jgi:hypothetical protein
MYARSQGTRYAIEVFANVQELKGNPHMFDYDMEKITKDMFLFSLVAYIAAVQSDWQLEQETYKTSNGTITHWKNKSNATNPNECTPFTRDDIKSLLNKSGNIFANTDLSRFMFHIPQICLPPRSALRRLILSQVNQNLGLAGQIRNRAGFEFFGRS